MKTEDITQDMWRDIAFIKASKNRTKVIKSIAKGPKIPKEVSIDSGIPQGNISMLLRQLADKELIICINPEIRKGRIYRLTEKSEKIMDMI